MMRNFLLLTFLTWAVVLLRTPTFAADAAPTLTIPEGAQSGPSFDVDRATEAWVGTLSPEQRAKSDAYFEGGYVLQLVGFLYGLGVAAVFLLTRLSSRMRALAERVAKGALPRSVIYAVQYILLLDIQGAIRLGTLVFRPTASMG